MQGFTTKLTAYDFLGMLIPGIVVVYFICCEFCQSELYETSNWFYCGCNGTTGKSPTVFGTVCKVIVLISFSYIIGIVVNLFSDLIFGRFRNNELHITLASLLYRKRQYGAPKKTKSHKRIDKGETKLLWRFLRQTIGFRKRVYTPIEKNYYFRYYWLLNTGKLSGSVTVLESQVVFARNMVLPTLAMAVLSFISTDIMCGVLYISLCFFELMIMYSRQMRIYYIVFEDFKWYKQMSDDDKEINNSVN